MNKYMYIYSLNIAVSYFKHGLHTQNILDIRQKSQSTNYSLPVTTGYLPCPYMRSISQHNHRMSGGYVCVCVEGGGGNI